MAHSLLLDVPSLENGARLKRDEFIRRSELDPEIRRAELIEGVVYLPMAVEFPRHTEPQMLMYRWLMSYEDRHPEVKMSASTTLILDDDNVVEPDALLFRTSTLGQEKYLSGAPEFVVEIANSSVSRDLHQKKEAYRRNGVREYIVWRVQDGIIDWFELVDGEYVHREPDADGIIESAQFPGLRLNVPAALALDRQGVLAALQG